MKNLLYFFLVTCLYSCDKQGYIFDSEKLSVNIESIYSENPPTTFIELLHNSASDRIIVEPRINDVLVTLWSDSVFRFSEDIYLDSLVLTVYDENGQLYTQMLNAPNRTEILPVSAINRAEELLVEWSDVTIFQSTIKVYLIDTFGQIVTQVSNGTSWAKFPASQLTGLQPGIGRIEIERTDQIFPSFFTNDTLINNETQRFTDQIEVEIL